MSSDSAEAVNANPDVVIEGRKLSMTFERKLGLPDYGNVVCRAWVETTIPMDADQATIALAVKFLALPLKAAVLDELGIQTHIDESGIIRELLTPAVSSVEAAGKTKRAFPGATSSKAKSDAPTAASGSTTADGIKVLQSKGPLPQWAVDAAAKQGITEMFDNRQSENVGPLNPKAPWFKEAVKDSNKAIWAPR